MSRRSHQESLFGADVQYLGFVGPESLRRFLAQHGRQLFRDEDFPELRRPDTGRPSVPPSLLALALLLQAHDRVSDAQATQRAAVDSRVILGRGGVEDTYNLISHGIRQLVRVQAGVEGEVG